MSDLSRWTGPLDPGPFRFGASASPSAPVWVPETTEEYDAYTRGELSPPAGTRVVLPPKVDR